MPRVEQQGLANCHRLSRGFRLDMDSAIKPGFRFEHAPGAFSKILVSRIVPCTGELPCWEICIDSHTSFSPKQYSSQVFSIYGGRKIIRVTVVESGLSEPKRNRTRLIVQPVANGSARARPRAASAPEWRRSGLRLRIA